MGGEVGIPHLIGIVSDTGNKVSVLEVAVEAGDILTALLHHGAIDRGSRIDDFGGHENDQFTLVMLELGRAEQGSENGDIAQPREFVDGVIARE